MTQIDYVNLVQQFHNLYYQLGHLKQGTWDRTYWMGVPIEKCPSDMWVYQELLFRIRPQLIIETGTRHGGSALFFAQMCDLLGSGEVVTVDIVRGMHFPRHPRLTYLTGSSTDPQIVEQVRARAVGKSPVFVILDSDHSYQHVINEMRLYHPLVTPGSYMVVEDTNVNGHPVLPEHGPGPMEAVHAFMTDNHEFQVDRDCEHHLLTMHPYGWLRKRQGASGPPTPTAATMG
jgi:cephalosporin hydroxylase